jgi:hypothetical protein
MSGKYSKEGAGSGIRGNGVAGNLSLLYAIAF